MSSMPAGAVIKMIAISKITAMHGVKISSLFVDLRGMCLTAKLMHLSQCRVIVK